MDYFYKYLKGQTFFTFLKELILLTSIASLSAGQTDTSSSGGYSGSDSILIHLDSSSYFSKRVHQIELPPFSAEGVKPEPTDADKKDVMAEQHGVKAAGTISRGLQFSDGSQLSLQSSMYLKLSGTLGEHYRVSGTLSERSSPLQPIGNTRRLNDFEKVSIKIQGPHLNLSMGDIMVQANPDKFGRLERNIEGLDVHVQRGGLQAESSIGFSYGTYHVQKLQVVDGKQGPYRLMGKNGERFIIVLAGSEKIRLGETTLQRGEDADYIIDYNAAEITFTPRRMLSSNIEIHVEFEYVPDIYLSNYSFGKQLLRAGGSLETAGRVPLKFSIHASELRDDKQNPLGEADGELLSSLFETLPDSVATIQTSTIREDSVDGAYVQHTEGYLVFAGSGSGTHTADFTFVGLERGSYRKVLEDGEYHFSYDTLNGEYSTDQYFIAPGSHQLLSTQMELSLGVLKVNVENGFSQNVKNLYADDRQTHTRGSLDASLSAAWDQLKVSASQRFLQEGFLTHNQLDPISFYQKWQTTPRSDEREVFNNLKLSMGKNDSYSLRTDYSSLWRSHTFTGTKLDYSATAPLHRMLQLQARGIRTQTAAGIRHEHDLQGLSEIRKVKVSTQVQLENGNQSSLYSSKDHLTGRAGLEYAFREDHALTLSTSRRYDYQSMSDQSSIQIGDYLNDWTEQREDVNLTYQLETKRSTDISIMFKHRNHKLAESSSRQFFLGGVNLSTKTFNEQVDLGFNAKLDEEQVPKFEYHYLEVDTGYGNFSYDPHIHDYVPTGGGRFIRQRIFSDIEKQVRNAEGRFTLTYASLSHMKDRRKGFGARFKSNFERREETLTGKLLQDRLSNTLQLDYHPAEGSRIHTINYTVSQATHQTLLNTFGNESNSSLRQEMESVVSWGLKQSSRLGVQYENRSREREYNTLASEDWRQISPYLVHELTSVKSGKYGLKFQYQTTQDRISGSKHTELYAEAGVKHNFRKRGRVDQKMYMSQLNSPLVSLPYAMFQGRQPGLNWKYNLTFRYRFSNQFQLSSTYSIQKRGDAQAEKYFRIEGKTFF